MRRIRIKAFVTVFCLGVLIMALTKSFKPLPPLGNFLSPFTGYLQSNSNKLESNELNLGKLKEPVTVFIDERSVPHVFAKNDDDLFFIQGYFHARDRLWQMDFLSRVASGRLSEIVAGKKILLKDRLTRRKGLLSSAERSMEFIRDSSPETMRHFESYSNGVNAYLKELKNKKVPVEFKLLNYFPEEWTPLKTVLIQRFMAEMLSGYDEDAERTNFLNQEGWTEYQRIFRDKLLSESTMIDSLPMKKESIILGKSELPAKGFPQKKYVFVKDQFQPDPGYGSNTWAISGSKSVTGFPVLANDPHLSLTLPSIWYEIQLSSGKSNTYGVSIPGIPYIISGFNENIAWGITSGQTDVKDWYVTKFKNNNSEYLLNNKWEKTEKKEEIFYTVSGNKIIDTVLKTKIGPIVYDDKFNPDSGSFINMALRWQVNSPSNDLNTFYLLNNAVTYEDYRNAIKNFCCPNLNFSFASKTDIAISHQGKIPSRKRDEGEFVIDSEKSCSLTFETISPEALPHQKNPVKGFVFSANQMPVDSNFSYRMYGYYNVYRNRIISRYLEEKDKFSTSDMMNLQLNNYDLFASEALPLMLKNMNIESLSGEEKEIIDSLIVWNFSSDKSSVASFLFQIWWEAFYNETWDEFGKRKSPALLPSIGNTINILRNDPADKYFDIVATKQRETSNELLVKSLKTCVSRYKELKQNNEKLTLGTMRGTFFNHLASIPAFSSEKIACGGSKNAVNATTANWGPGWRMIVEFTKDRPIGWGIKPGGQSGNPGNDSYQDGIDDWANGKYYRLEFLKEEQVKSMKGKILIIK